MYYSVAVPFRVTCSMVRHAGSVIAGAVAGAGAVSECPCVYFVRSAVTVVASTRVNSVTRTSHQSEECFFTRVFI